MGCRPSSMFRRLRRCSASAARRLPAHPHGWLADAGTPARQAHSRAERTAPRARRGRTVKRGSYFERHMASCPRDLDGSCCLTAVAARGVTTSLRAGTGCSRNKRSGAGFPSPNKTAAQKALRLALDSATADFGHHNLTVAQYLESWHAGKRKLKPTTAVAYRSYLDHYLLPQLGHIRLLRTTRPPPRPGRTQRSQSGSAVGC